MCVRWRTGSTLHVKVSPRHMMQRVIVESEVTFCPVLVSSVCEAPFSQPVLRSILSPDVHDSSLTTACPVRQETTSSLLQAFLFLQILSLDDGS